MGVRHIEFSLFQFDIIIQSGKEAAAVIAILDTSALLSSAMLTRLLYSDDSIRNDENTRLGIKQVLQNQTDHQSRNADLLAHHTSALTLVQKGIESVKDVQVTHASEHQVASEQITQKLTSIRSRVDKLPDISSQQSQAMQEMQEMLGMLAEILHRLPSKEREPLAAAPDLQDGSSSARYSSKADSHSRGMHVGEKSECPDGLDREDSDLFQCVSRLSRLARTESKRMVSDEAQSIIDDLERLLQIVSNQLMSSGTGGVREEKRRHRETCNTHGSSSSDILQQQLDLKKLRGLLISSGEVMVNQRGEFFSISEVIATKRSSSAPRNASLSTPGPRPIFNKRL